MTRCIFCKLPAYERCYSDAGRREVRITGLCEICFDKCTKESDEEEAKVFDIYSIRDNPICSIPTEYAYSREHAIKKAEKNQLVIVEPDAHTLQLDFDTDEQWQLFLQSRLPRLVNFIAVDRVWWKESKSGNKHVYIKLRDEYDSITRIAMQAALGSDPTRELLSIMCNICDEDKIMLFEKPDAVEHVIYATDGYQPSLAAGDTQLMLTAGEPPYDDDIPY